MQNNFVVINSESQKEARLVWWPSAQTSESKYLFSNLEFTSFCLSDHRQVNQPSLSSFTWSGR